MQIFNKRKNKNKTKNGFTLVEMLVSISLFSVVMVLALSALFFVIEGGRKARSVSSVIGNLSYALENMFRNIRAGHNYNCGASLPIENDEKTNDCWESGKNIIAFESMEGSSGDTSDQWVFKYDDEEKKLKRSTDGGSTFIEMTSDNVVIEKMKFYVRGSSDGDTLQPMVVMVINGYVEISKGTKSEFNIQTTSTQRILDF